MKITVVLKTRHYLARLCIFLIAAALVGGMVGCGPIQYNVTVSSTEGGQVSAPGEGTFAYDEGTLVNLVAEADEGCQFVNWTGNVSAIAGVYAATTTITINGHYSITANFAIAIEIWDWYDLDAIRNDLGGSYVLMNDLDSTTAGYEELASPTANGGKGWEPIGTSNERFAGVFDGQEHEIKDLFLNRPEEDNVGLFGSIGEGGVVKDIGVVNASVLGHEDVGSLVGDNGGTVSNCYATGNISSNHWNVGGLVGRNYEGTVVDSYSNGRVSGHSGVGGLVGFNIDIVRNSHSSASVTGTMVGGLVGVNWYNGTVSNSYSTGNVTGDESVYGYGEYVGGLVAANNGDITSSYSTSTVTGDRYIGGLVAVNTHTVNHSYSTGSVTGINTVGGLVGDNSGTVNNSFWDMETSGQSTSDGGTGKNTAEMQKFATFSSAEWSIIAVALNETNPAYIWNIVNGVTYPFLSWQP